MSLKADTVKTKEKRTGFTFRGQEIILSKTHGRPFSGLVAKGMARGIYPEKKRIEAVTLYAALGNYTKVSEFTNIPVPTLKTWRKQDWFQELLNEIREENNEKIDAKFTEIVEKSLDLIVDRLEHGDFAVHPKTGELVRKPVGVRDLSLVSAINIDKRQLLRGLPTSRSETVADKGLTKLEQLAEAFVKLANTKREVKVIDITPIEVKDDNQENQRRLQSSVGEVRQESGWSKNLGGSQEASGTGRIL